MGVSEQQPRMSVELLFPTFVSKFKLGRDLSPAELDFLMNAPTRSNMGNIVSIDSNILSDNAVARLAEFIDSNVQFCLNELYRPKKNVKLRITQSWLNYTKKGEFHHKHLHPNSFISGVFYVNADKQTDKIYFYNERYSQITINPAEFNVVNSKAWWFPVETGDLILFPSHLVHSVETVDTERVRASLAFNTFPVGYVGDDLELTGLHLGN